MASITSDHQRGRRLSNEFTDLEAEALGDEIAELASYLAATEARLLALIARFEAADGAGKLGFASTAHWLNYRCGLGMNAAREKVRVANALTGLPTIRASFASGRLSYSKVRALTRVADGDNEDYLLDLATYGTAHHVERVVALYRRAGRVDDPEVAERVYAERHLSYRYDDDGALVLNARLPAESGALVVKALERAMDRAQAEAGSETGSEAESDRPPAAARRADALAEIAETFLNHHDPAGSTADRYQVVVHLTAAMADSGSADERRGVTAVTGSGGSRAGDGAPTGGAVPLGAAADRRIACDAALLPVLDNALGELLSIGRRSRTVPPSIRRALRLRDGGCRFPGCTHRRFVDAHHLVHWADGGETSLDNLLLLCRRHHRLLHEGGMTARRTASGEIVFEDSRHRPLSAAGRLPGIGIHGDIGVALEAWLDRQVFEGEAESDGCAGPPHDALRAKYGAGDAIDWDLAVANLMDCGENGAASEALPR